MTKNPRDTSTYGGRKNFPKANYQSAHTCVPRRYTPSNQNASAYEQSTHYHNITSTKAGHVHLTTKINHPVHHLTGDPQCCYGKFVECETARHHAVKTSTNRKHIKTAINTEQLRAPVIHPVTSENISTYQKPEKDYIIKKIWIQSFVKELDKLVQGDNKRKTKGT